MAVLAFGEGYHNYHHSFPLDYRNGIRPLHFDPAKWMIFGLSRVDMARDLRRASDTAILKAKVAVQLRSAAMRQRPSTPAQNAAGGKSEASASANFLFEPRLRAILGPT